MRNPFQRGGAEFFEVRSGLIPSVEIVLRKALRLG